MMHRSKKIRASVVGVGAIALLTWQLGTAPLASAATTKFEAEKLTVVDDSGIKPELLTPCTDDSDCLSFPSDKQGASITYALDVSEAGTYSVKVGIKTAKVRGKFQLAVQDGSGDYVNVGGVEDGYTKGYGFKTDDLGSVTFASAGTKNFRFTNEGKNGSSKSYQLVTDYISLTQSEKSAEAVAAPAPTEVPVTEAPVSEAPVADETEAPAADEPVAPIADEPTKPIIDEPVTPVTEAPPSQAPSPTEAPAPATNSDGGKANASNTGVPAGTNLTVHDGNWVITKDGTVIDGADVHGFILVRAANVTIKNSIVRGGTASTNTGLINVMHKKAKNVTISNNELVPSDPSRWIDGIFGHDFTATGNHIHNVVDGIGVFNPSNGNGAVNVSIRDNYIHDLTIFKDNHYDGHSHNDGIQIQGNSGIDISGNTIIANINQNYGINSPYGENATGQAIGITPNTGPVSDVSITNNFLDRGASSITIIPGKYTASATVTGNTFGNHQKNKPFLIDNSLKSKISVSGNTIDGGSAMGASFAKIG